MSQMSTRAKPSVAMALATRSPASSCQTLVRARNDGLEGRTVPRMSSGCSMLPLSVVEVNEPVGVVTECCPPVMP